MPLYLSSQEGEVKDLRSRCVIILVLFCLGFLAIMFRLWLLQVKDAQHYMSLSESNFVKHERIPHPRGIIFDTKGRILVDNRPSYDLHVTVALFRQKSEESLRKLRAHMRLSDDELEAIRLEVQRTRGLAIFQPLLVKRDLSWEQLAHFEIFRAEFPGVEVIHQPHRNYRYGKMAAHVLGYMNEISQQEYERLRERDYRKGDYIGRMGVERLFEDRLRGKDGLQKKIVDAKGRELRDPVVRQMIEAVDTEERIEATPGKNVYLTIDAQLQEVAERAFTGLAGAVVALDPSTGYVLAMLSRPAYDPNVLTGRLSVEQKEILDTDPLQPWINKAIQQHYSPGSSFKPVPALAALAEKVISPSEELYCGGAYRFGTRAWRCWRDKGHGHSDMVSGIMRSCDVYFYQLGLRVGMDRMAKWAVNLGLGSPTGIGLDREEAGLIPDVNYYKKRFKGEFHKGVILNNVIGQGDVNVTPMQLALAYSAIASRGSVYVPQVVRRVENPDGSLVEEFQPKLRSRIELPGEVWKTLIDGLTAVVESPGGTAYARRIKGIRVAGKTGTAQVVEIKEKRKSLEQTDYWLRDHAWFVAFSPPENPAIVVGVVHEHGGHGSSGAAPIAMEVIRGYYEKVEGLTLSSAAPHAAVPAQAAGQATEESDDAD